MKNTAPFILFEGIDGAGKGTQLGLFSSFLEDRGISHVTLAEPTDGVYGKEIRAILKSGKAPSPQQMVDLFILDREDDVKRNVMPALSSGKAVVMDRYYYSNAAYQGAMGLDYRMILADNIKRNFPVPDRVYLLDIPPALAMERIQGRSGNSTELFEKQAFLEKVRELYTLMCDDRFIMVDGTLDSNTISEMISEDFCALFNID